MIPYINMISQLSQLYLCFLLCGTGTAAYVFYALINQTQHLLTCKVSRYCLLALQGRIIQILYKHLKIKELYRRIEWIGLKILEVIQLFNVPKDTVVQKQVKVH